MVDHPGWYPPDQVCYPPNLPTYLKNVYDLKPIAGVPSDDEVIAIHMVMQVANRASGIPGMHDSRLLMGLADHLFEAQMAKYRRRYSLSIFPSGATYTPPALPAHIPITLEPVSGAPSDDELIRVQDAIRAYQQFSLAPLMFDAHLNMELSQHLFNLQMARFMRYADQSQPSSVAQAVPRPASPFQATERTANRAEDITTTANNAGTGAEAVGIHPSPPLAHGIDMHEEPSRDAVGRRTQSTEQLNPLADRFGQVLERLTQLVEKVCRPADKHDQLAERFNQLLERFIQVTEESNRPAQQAYQLSERTNQLLDWSNQLVEQLSETVHESNQLLSQVTQQIQQPNQATGPLNHFIEGFNKSLRQSNELAQNANQLSEQANKHGERLGDVMKNINKVLVGIQHAIVRNHKDNTLQALDCLVNEVGEKPGYRGLKTPQCPTVKHLIRTQGDAADDCVPVVINGVSRDLYIKGHWLGDLLRFFEINDGLYQNKGTSTLAERGKAERERLSEYLSSCLG
ncbi:unnamed protein product [Rhizoctonia solani]|uniref:Laminin domain protein n=1 Tax=Rhizoctonia solani TaxID=456999 RepID=A0A8H3DIC8_9AGAM|nr:unnamed protein product [Rhizoctonia solani]